MTNVDLPCEGQDLINCPFAAEEKRSAYNSVLALCFFQLHNGSINLWPILQLKTKKNLSQAL